MRTWFSAVLVKIQRSPSRTDPRPVQDGERSGYDSIVTPVPTRGLAGLTFNS